MSERVCGTCSACCTVVPVKALDKPANTRCRHQRFKHGCAVYHRGKPAECALWSCAWLNGAAIPRPDRAGWVVDVVPDVVIAEEDERSVPVPVIQVWCDAQRPDAWDCPALFDYLERERMAAIIRHGSDRAIVLMPPWLMQTGRWVRKPSTLGQDADRLTQARRAMWAGELG